MSWWLDGFDVLGRTPQLPRQCAKSHVQIYVQGSPKQVACLWARILNRWKLEDRLWDKSGVILQHLG